jgi:cobalamin biosynthesis Mg chelatase CobN
METYDPHKSTTEVRGANRRTDNFRVLIIGVVAILILFGIIYFIFGMGSAGQNTV